MAKYTVDIVRSAGEDSWTSIVYTGNNKAIALEVWADEQYNYPTCVSINSYTKEDALELLQYASENLDWLHELCRKPKFPYKWNHIEEGIREKIADECRGFLGETDWITDMIHPFDIG